MCTCGRRLGLGNLRSKEERLQQVLKNGLRIQATIEGRAWDIKLPPEVASSPDISQRHPECREYWALPSAEHDKVAATVSRIFKEATGIVPDLDPKDPKDKPWIRIWLTLRDTVMARRTRDNNVTFFVEYDLRFLPDDTLGLPAKSANMTEAQKHERLTDLDTIRPLLDERAVARFDAAEQGQIFEGKPVSLTVRTEAKRLSWAQIYLIREFFGMPNDAIRWSAFQRAFEQFTNGELRNPSRGPGAGEPDGGAQFQFAEFAWLCVESDVHKGFWEKALRTFVKTQEIFVHVYRPARGSASTPASPTSGPDRLLFERYTFKNFKARRQFNEEKKRKLRAKYDRMTLIQLRRAMREQHAASAAVQ